MCRKAFMLDHPVPNLIMLSYVIYSRHVSLQKDKLNILFVHSPFKSVHLSYYLQITKLKNDTCAEQVCNFVMYGIQRLISRNNNNKKKKLLLLCTEVDLW